jgi:hypothetical protein
MKIASFVPSTLRTYKSPELPQKKSPDPEPPRSEEPSILKSALIGAAYGGMVGASTALLYQSQPLATATTYHMTGIVAGGLAGTSVLGRAMQPKVEAPAAYALGALAGAGITWGTSAFGLLHQPVVGAVAGAALGAFYGGIGAFLLRDPK